MWCLRFSTTWRELSPLGLFSDIALYPHLHLTLSRPRRTTHSLAPPHPSSPRLSPLIFCASVPHTLFLPCIQLPKPVMFWFHPLRPWPLTASLAVVFPPPGSIRSSPSLPSASLTATASCTGHFPNSSGQSLASISSCIQSYLSKVQVESTLAAIAGFFSFFPQPKGHNALHVVSGLHGSDSQLRGKLTWLCEQALHWGTLGRPCGHSTSFLSTAKTPSQSPKISSEHSPRTLSNLRVPSHHLDVLLLLPAKAPMPTPGRNHSLLGALQRASCLSPGPLLPLPWILIHCWLSVFLVRVSVPWRQASYHIHLCALTEPSAEACSWHMSYNCWLELKNPWLSEWEWGQ